MNLALPDMSAPPRPPQWWDAGVLLVGLVGLFITGHRWAKRARRG